MADIRTYVYGATYDSWNRVQTMTYPDGEVVTYHYNAAGQVESMTSNKQGRQSVIVDRIGYDKEGHTVYTKLGNGTETIYTYDKQRERLQVMNLTADGQTVMENKYRYDAVDNILSITNAANPTSLTKLNKAKLGGRSSHTYEYDGLNRLVHASGKAKRASYDMVMSFGRMSEPLTKVQKVDSTTTAKSYNFAYKYEDSCHPTAPTQIGHDHYTYDANGNPTLVTNDSANTTREMYWDEDNRLMVLSDNGKTSRYTYNGAGERIMKSYGTMEGAYGDPENTGVGYNVVLTELGNHDVPQGWIQTPHPNTTPNTNPGPPVSWNDPSNPDDPQAGYGYIANDTTKEETFFYHSDHLGSTSYITDDHANITQYDAYLPYGELLVDEHSSSEELPYKFNGKQFDDETGLYYYGARYMNPVTSLWYGVDPLAEKYVATGGYVYTLDNPVRLIDPNGNWSWPWERGSLIEYRGNGVFGIRIENFSKTMQSNFKRANNNPANWRPGELGINTEIGKNSVDNYAHKSFTIGRKPAGIDPKDGNVRIRRPIAKSTGQEDRRFHSFDPMPVRGSAKAVGVIAILDFANYAVDTYMTLSTFWDSNAFDDQMASFRKAIRAVNSQMNSIPDNYRKDTNKMGAILNYVFQGENTTKDKNIDKIGQNILSKSGRYDRTNKTYKPFIKR